MNPFVECLTEDHKPSVEAWFDAFLTAADNLRDLDVPVLKLCYMVDDYEELVNQESANYNG